MKDYFETEIKIGDEVAFIFGKSFCTGTVIEFNKKKVTIRAMEYGNFETCLNPKYVIVRRGE